MATWNLTAMTAKFRDLTGMPSANQIADSVIFTLINDFYVERFPLTSELPEFSSIVTALITTADSDSGEYTALDGIISIEQPVDLFDSDSDLVATGLKIYRDAGLFFADYPRNPDTATGQPAALLWYGLKFFLRPIADAVYTVDAGVTRKAVTALTVGADVPLSNGWGIAIAYGAAAEYLTDLGDDEALARTERGYAKHLGLLGAKEISRKIGERPVPQF